MNIHRAGKQTKAFWRAVEKHAEKAAADPMLVVPANTAHHFDVERRRSFAAGWIAGVNYLRRQRGADTERPLYGHKTGAKARTHWVAFLKANTELGRAERRP